ncbi:ABC transporter permease, partial [Sulfurovum sp. bin170]|uniref:ABC transporter permease n=1 Tax=Sulfurovum sp. bin170 TaxID=2695268 RepID=UPI0013DE8F37
MYKRTPWQVQKSVIYALFLREVNVRFSAGKLGYFWVIFEPLMQISIFVTVKVLLFGSNSGLDYPVFITLGFVAFNLFKHLVDRSMSSFSTNKGLYAYKQVKPIDTLIARVMVEVLVTGVIAVVFIIFGLYFGFDMSVQNLGVLILSFLWLILFSLSVGLFIAVIGLFFDSFQKVVKLILSPLMFISAIFYSMQDMPQALQGLLYYNPIVHFMELIHASYFYILDDGFVDYGYIMIWTIVPMYLSLFLYTKLE